MRPTLVRFTLAGAVAAALVSGGAPRPAWAVLGTPGFRAVGVAHSSYPVSALAVAPDGRLFAAVQALGAPAVPEDPATAEIRVYSTYATGDGAVLDEGTVWATVENVRARQAGEGLLGIALAPDFATSGLVYVYVTAADEDDNQHVRVYRENAAGTGDYLGTVATGLEPPEGSTGRNGGPLAFGADGCLYVGVGDNGGGGRWNAQLLVGTDPIGSTETNALCTEVCQGSALYPERTIVHDGAPNHAGKVLRLAVEGPSPAQAAPGAPLAAQPFVFAAGMRNPGGLAVHPLTGQLYATDVGDVAEAEIDVVDGGSNLGWPCLEGSVVASGGAACLAGGVADDVYANHPEWRRPLATHGGTSFVVAGASAYTGLGYPAEYYGDVFYLLRNSARIYRLDLEPPCFLPHPNGVAPVAFHDSDEDGDFRVLLDVDGDGEYEDVGFPNLVAIAEGPDPRDDRVLYVAGKQGNSGALDDDTVVFRLQFATAFTPYAGPRGRVADSCFTDGVYSGGGSGTPPYGWENPFLRPRCALPGGPCPGAPDGTPCDGGDPCRAAGSCQAGVCRAGAAVTDGTSCRTGACREDGVCQAGTCLPGAPLADGTACASGDPCAGGMCRAGVCEPGGGPAPLAVRAMTVKRETRGPGSGALVLSGSFRPAASMAPETADDVTVELRDGGGTILSAVLDHPASDPFWKRPRPGTWRYRDRWGGAAGLTTVILRQGKSGAVQLTVHGKGMALPGLDEAVNPRLVIGDQCFEADLAGRCRSDPRRLRCGR